MSITATKAALATTRRPISRLAPFQIVVGVFLALRLFANFNADPVGDEAYYWMWGQHLGFSYFDHPPLHAWLLSLVNQVFGWNLFSIRILTWFTLAGTLAIFWDWAGRLAPRDPVAYFWRAAEMAHPADFLAGTRYSTASQLGFALGRSDVIALSIDRDQYDYWFDATRYAGKNALVLTDESDGAPALSYLAGHFSALSQIADIPIERFGQPVYHFRIFLAENYR